MTPGAALRRFAQRTLRLIGAGLLIAAQPVSGADNATPPREVTINGVEFIHISAGWFYKTGGVFDPTLSHQPMEESGGNARIWLDDYYIAKYEARARHFAAFMNERIKPDPKGQALAKTYGGDTEGCAVRHENDNYVLVDAAQDLPATHLSWVLADEFARWMGFRLPSEAEWEKAARGDDKRLWPWGDEFPDETYAGFLGGFECSMQPVNRFEKGRSPYGVYNMSGNVREFVADWFNADYDKRLVDGLRNPPLAEKGTTRDNVPVPAKILKGGRWASGSNGILISARVYYKPEEPFRCNGTRFAIDAAKVREHLARGTAQVTRP